MNKVLIACVALFSLTANYAYAETYTYTGLNFTDVEGAYTTDMSVTGSITTSSPIPPNSVNLDITPLITDWAFSDGVQTMSSANGDLLHQFVGPEVPPLSFSTDALGNIISADIIVNLPQPTALGETLSMIYTVASISTDSGVLDAVCIEVSNGLCIGYNIFEEGLSLGMVSSVGTWGPVTLPAASSVPTMSIWGLGLLIALMGVFGFSRRRQVSFSK